MPIVAMAGVTWFAAIVLAVVAFSIAAAAVVAVVLLILVIAWGRKLYRSIEEDRWDIVRDLVAAPLIGVFLGYVAAKGAVININTDRSHQVSGGDVPVILAGIFGLYIAPFLGPVLVGRENVALRLLSYPCFFFLTWIWVELVSVKHLKFF